MNNVYQFSTRAIQFAIQTAARQDNQQIPPHEASDINVVSALTTDLNSGKPRISILTDRLDVTLESGKICLKLPFNIGKKSIPFLDIYNGEAAYVYLWLSTASGIPVGLKITGIVNGITVFEKTFGTC